MYHETIGTWCVTSDTGSWESGYPAWLPPSFNAEIDLSLCEIDPFHSDTKSVADPNHPLVSTADKTFSPLVVDVEIVSERRDVDEETSG